VLGQLRVHGAGGATGVAAGRERVLLALLLLNANQLVPLGRVVEALWGEQPPPTARAQVHTCVSRLRRLLRAGSLPDDVVVTEPAGYLIRVGDGELDSIAFTRLRERGHAYAAAGDLPAARAALREALDLWRGPALADVDSSVVQAAAARLTEERSGAHEECIDVELRLGRASDVLGELTDLVEAYPLRERLRAQLMTRWSRSGGRPMRSLRTGKPARCSPTSLASSRAPNSKTCTARS